MRPLEDSSLLGQRLLSKPGVGPEVPQRSRHPHQFMQFWPIHNNLFRVGKRTRKTFLKFIDSNFVMHALQV